MNRDTTYGRPNRTSGLCPNCRKLISFDEERCPYCGLRNPGSRWKSFGLGALLGPDRIITNLIVINAGMFILSILLSPGSIGMSGNPLFFLSPGQRSLQLLGETGIIPILRTHNWLSLLSANYLHGSILHIFFNMMALRQIGPFVIQEYGPYRMFSIYTVSGVAGFFISVLRGIPYTLGASGAICGLIGAALYFGKSRGGQYGQMVYQQVGGWAISIFVFGFLVQGINNWAHGGGLLFGVITAFIMGYQERRPENYRHKIVAMVCAAATLIALAKGLLGIF